MLKKSKKYILIHFQVKSTLYSKHIISKKKKNKKKFRLNYVIKQLNWIKIVDLFLPKIIIK